MENLILVPMEDSVVFPGMTATLAVEIGEEERVLLVPRIDGEFASVGTVAKVVERMRIPGGGMRSRSRAWRGGSPAPPHTGTAGTLRVEVTEPRGFGAERRSVRAVEREYRAVVEEILELRGADARIRAFLRSITEPGALADTAGYSPDLSLREKRELLETLDVTERLERALELQRERLAELQVQGEDPRRRPVGRRAAAARVLPAQADRIDPQGAWRGRGLGRRRVPPQDRRGRHAGRRARAGREGARSPGADGRAQARPR